MRCGQSGHYTRVVLTGSASASASCFKSILRHALACERMCDEETSLFEKAERDWRRACRGFASGGASEVPLG